MNKPKSIFKRVLNAVLVILAASMVTSEAQANAGWAPTDAGPLARTYYAHSPQGLHSSLNCFDNSGGQANPTPGGACDTGAALAKFIEPLPLVALPGNAPFTDSAYNKYFSGATGSSSNSKYIPVAIPTNWISPNGVMTNDKYYEIAAVQYRHRFHSSLYNSPTQGTLTRGYVQIDPAYTDSQANLSNGALDIPNSQHVALVDPITGAPILIPRPDSNANPGNIPSTDVLGDDGLPYKMVPAYAVDAPHYLGPVITASRYVPTRVKFINLLPAGRANTTTGARNGDLFLPVDETLPGAAFGPDKPRGGKVKFTQNRALINLSGGDNPWISDGTPHQWITPAGEKSDPLGVYAEALAKGVSSADASHYIRGWSAVNVPDMPDPGPGAMTYYYPNGQSPRMEWYHDNSFGLGRLNLYAGLASLYMLDDPSDLVARQYKQSGDIPAEQIPLVFQDKTFVPKDIAIEDAKWTTTYWGDVSDLWYPHVYETNQDGGYVVTSGANASPFGRWDWGPWFWPVFPSMYDRLPDGSINLTTTMTINNQPANVGLTEVTSTPKAIMDTVVVNGQAYPTLTVDPKAYRFRMLNASNDRYYNFGLYLAADKNTYNTAAPAAFDHQPVVCDGQSTRPGTTVVPAVADCTEVKMVYFDTSYPSSYYPTIPSAPFGATGSFSFPGAPNKLGTADGWGSFNGMLGHGGKIQKHPLFPDPATTGPDINVIGSDGGYLAQVADIPSTPVNYEDNTRSITITNVLQKGLYLAPGSRSDVVIDFSQYAGQTLILYNDGPAPSPAADMRYDFYSGNGDFTAAGGSDETIPGYGPNTRTVMQIYVNPVDVAQPVQLDTAKLNAAVPVLFANNQPMPIVPEPDFKTAYPTDTAINQLWLTKDPKTNQPVGVYNDATIMTGAMCGATAAADCSSGRTGYQGFDFTTTQPITFTQIPLDCATDTACKKGKKKVTLPNGGAVVNAFIEHKTVTEEFEPSYGRMYATLGNELAYMSSQIQTSIPLAYVDPATDKIADGETQIWRITHNGVDDHPLHFEFLNVQVIDRVGWDGTLKLPPPDELGWKDTVIAHPLEDIFLAVRAKSPVTPFGLPVSSRPRDPSQKIGVGGPSTINNQTAFVTSGFTQVDAATGNPADVYNLLDKYVWEYTWHSAAMGDQQNDMMRPFVFDYWNAKDTLGTNQVMINLPSAPTGVAISTSSVNGVTQYGNVLTWNDPTPASVSPVVDNPKNEYAFTVTRWDVTTTPAVNTGSWDVPANQTYFMLPATPNQGKVYGYDIRAKNALGSSVASSLVTVPVSNNGLLPPVLNPATSISATSLQLSWINASTGATKYLVQYKQGAANVGSWGPLSEINAPGQSSNPVVYFTTPSSLSPNTLYSFRVQAVNGSLTATSNAISVTTNPNVASNLAAVSNGPSSAIVSWTAPASGNGTQALVVKNVVTGKTSGTVGSISAAGTTVSGLTANTNYSVNLKVSGANGVVSDLTVLFTTNAAAATFSSAAVTNIATSSTNIASADIAWTNPASVSNTKVAISGGGSIAFIGNSTSSATASNLIPNTLYTVTVSEIGTNGAETKSGTTFTTTPGEVSSIAFSRTAATTGTIAWTLPSGGGVATVAVTTTALTKPVVTVNGTNNGATVTGLVAGKVYDFLVTLNGARPGNTQSLTGVMIIGAPTGVAAQLNSPNTVLLTFTPVTGAVGYVFQTSNNAGGTWTSLPSPSMPVVGSALVTLPAALAANSVNQFRIIGVDASGSAGLASATSTPATVNLTVAPAAGTLTISNVTPGQIAITINKAATTNNVDRIDIYRRHANAPNTNPPVYPKSVDGGLVGPTVAAPTWGWTLVTSLNGTDKTYIDPRLTPKLSYQYFAVFHNAKNATTINTTGYQANNSTTGITSVIPK